MIRSRRPVDFLGVFFSPDGKQLGLGLITSQSPGDVYSIDPWGIDETWIRPHVTLGSGRIFGDGDNNLELDWLISDGTVILRVNSGDTAVHVEATCPESLTALEWTHLAVTWDRERALKMFSYIKEDRTEDIPKSLCTPSGLPK